MLCDVMFDSMLCDAKLYWCCYALRDGGLCDVVL